VAPERVLPWAGDFLRFGMVGVVGFVTNVLTLYCVRRLLGLYAGGILAWVAAASVTWWLNRTWTFSGRNAMPAHRQWVLFLGANFLGFVLYYGTYVGLVTYSGFCAQWPVAAVFGGMLAGMVANFMLSRAWVFG
jgi:putative flippase GtrA